VKKGAPDDTRVRQQAERCLVAACAHISLPIVRASDQETSLRVLRDVLPDCAMSGGDIIALREAARQLINAQPGAPRRQAMDQLRHACERHLALVVAERFDAWRAAHRGEVT
jgi:hypothetical protein